MIHYLTRWFNQDTMMKFRKATREDLPAIVQMLADDQLGSSREEYRLPLPAEYDAAFSRIDADPNQELTVAVDASGEIVATLQLTFIPYLTYRGGIRAQIEAVRVRSDKRGEGIGERVFLWAIARAQERGAHLIQLTTDKKRPDAIRFYEKLGFQATHEGMKMFFGSEFRVQSSEF